MKGVVKRSRGVGWLSGNNRYHIIKFRGYEYRGSWPNYGELKGVPDDGCSDVGVV